GIWRELVVVLEESEKILVIEEIDEDNLDFIKFFHGENKELNEYRKKVILIGIKSLLERGDSYYWDKTVYFLYGVNSTGKSGGVALLLSFFSAYYEIEIPDNFAVTGKIDTHNGNIKKIGGLKSKIIQAIRNSKIKDVILPQENHKKALKILDDYHKRYSNPKILNLYP
ncbi:12533_t:CDS:1, partial [Ambispora leptoticha]